MKMRKLFKKRMLLVAGAMAGCVAGSAMAATPPTPPAVPTAPVMPAFQAVVAGNDVYDATPPPADPFFVEIDPTFSAGGYEPINTNQAFLQTFNPEPSERVGYLGSDGAPIDASYGNCTVSYFYSESNGDPVLINHTVNVQKSSLWDTAGSNYQYQASGEGVINNPAGLFDWGSGGYNWLKISQGGTLNTDITGMSLPNKIVSFGHTLSSGSYAYGTFVGTTLLPPIQDYGGAAYGSPTASQGFQFSQFLNLGGPETGYGIVNVSGGTWNDANSPVFIGYGGQGFVTVQNSGKMTLSSEGLIVGEDSAGLPVSWGAYSYSSPYTLPHLAAGIGTVVVESAGSLTLTGGGGYIALGRSVSSSGATGNLYVTGAGSTASVSQGILVGDGGYGYLAVLSGGQVTSASAYAAGGAKAYGVTSQPGSGNIVIDGVGSSWTVSGNADFGKTGVATVTVQNHGDLNILGTLTLGDESTGSGTLTVQADGTVESGAATLGNQSGATGFAEVGGTNTLWTVDGDLTVGNSGQGTLTLGSGGQITATGDATLGSQAGSNGNATISDPGTELQINGELKVGDKGNGTMSVENGGYVSLAGNLAIADSGGTSTLTLDGNGSRMIANGTSATIGGQGDGTMIVQNAADAVFSGASVSLGEKNGANGTLTVQGGYSTMSAGSLSVGGYGTGTLTVQDSASLSTGANISLGEQTPGTGTATIDNASVTDAGTLTIGGYGTGTLTIQNGGSLNVQGNDITLGEQNTGNGTLNLSGSGSTLTFNGDMTIGKSGSGTFAVSGGASFTGSAMTLASGSGFGGASTGGTGELDINGTSSVLLSQDLTIGKYGVGTLAMAGGAVLANKGDATLGSQPATEGSATLGSGSNWTVGGSLTDGSQGTGSITVQGGSSLIANGDSLTIGKQGEGSLSVTGAKSLVHYAGDLIIGKQAAGTFSVANGATTAPTASGTGDVYIAETSGINGALTVDGSGSNFAATNLVVGGTSSKAGGTGSVGLTNGGTLTVSEALTLWNTSSLDVTGGHATIGNAQQGTANGNIYVTSGGKLAGSGNITGNVLATSGTVDVGGATAGKLSITGNYEQTGGTISFTIAGAGSGQASQLDATGLVSLSGSTVEFDFTNHYAPTKGQAFQVIDPPQSVSLNDVSYIFTGLAPGFLFNVNQNANGLLFTALNTGIATSSPTPEPAGLAIVSLGAGLLLLRRRRIRQL